MKDEFDFNVGDYVETVEGEIGYIKELRRVCEEIRERWFITIIFTDGNCLVTEITGCGIYILGKHYLYENYFVRIGIHDFRKIKPKYNIGQKFELDYPQSKEDVLIKIHGCFKVVSISIRNEQVYYQMVDRYNGVFLTVKEKILNDCCKA